MTFSHCCTVHEYIQFRSFRRSKIRTAGDRMLIDVKLLVWVRKATRVMATAGWLDSFIGTLYGGIDPSIPGMGGRDCALHVPFRVKILEITGVIVYMAFLYVWTAKTLTPVTEDDVRVMKERDSRLGGNLKKVALMLLSLVFGMELTFKIVTGRLLFVLNPCHALTIVQVLSCLSVCLCVCQFVCLCVCLIARELVALGLISALSFVCFTKQMVG